LSDPNQKSGNLGKVYLVGAGPGDPALVTLRAIECLGQCDAVLYDYLANERILHWANPAATKICLGKHGVGKIWTQDQINQKLLSLASENKTIVRLKGGDPLIFGRSGEEIDALIHAQVPFEIVPGVTASVAAAAYCGLPLTHRQSASSLVLVTASRKDGDHECCDYKALANFPGTIAVYMGTTTVEYWANELMRFGKSPDTPVLIVRNATLPNQKVLSCQLGQVVQTVIGPPRLRPPAIFLVGEVVNHLPAQNWFMNKPLFGQTIMLTRAEHQNDEARNTLEAKGAQVLSHPMIQITASGENQVLKICNSLHRYGWIVFTSRNGVTNFFEQLFQLGKDARVFGNVRIAAIGKSTSRQLEHYYLNADLVPAEFRSEALVEQLQARINPDQRVLIVQGSRSRGVLPSGLKEAGINFDSLIVYRSDDVQTADAEIYSKIAEGEIDWVTVSSPAIARNFARLFGDVVDKIKIASLSPVTSQAIIESGLVPTVEADPYTFDGLIDAIQNHVQIYSK
jgi:uroporphyrinogen III methyltransferase / synthase